MQFLDVISVNIWAILASLANLLLLTWIIKRFLFKPVKKMMDARRNTIDEYYVQAQAARDEAEESRLNYEAAMAAANVLERKKAEAEMKHEIANVSAQLTGKLLQREINEEDHRDLIDSFLNELD